MKKALFICPFLSAIQLARKIAVETPDVEIDYFGPAILSPQLPNNLNRIGDIPKREEPRIRRLLDFEKLDQIKNNYDFIYAGDFVYQYDLVFQEWRKNVNVPVLCPSRECAHLEYSKINAKIMMKDLGIPFPDYEIVVENRWGQIEDIKDPHYYENDFILKIDKTMLRTGPQTRTSNMEQYKKTIASFRRSDVRHGTFFVEKMIRGREISAHFLCNGKEWIYLGSAKDYKRMYENDQGPNCSSTGSYSPVEYITEDVEKQMFSYMDKILPYLNEKGFPYHGVLYLGIMIDDNGIANILEINTRPGNPEFGVIINTINSKNLLENFYNAALGEKLTKVTHSDQKSVTINIINQNYQVIAIPKNINLKITPDERFTMVTFDIDYNGDNYFFNISRNANSVSEAVNEIYQYLETQDLTGFRYRKDIGS